MCGRFAVTLPPDAARSYFRYGEFPNFPPRFDVRPTQPVPVVTLSEGARHFMLMRWGFIPSFVKDEKEFPLLINTRSETAYEKPSFRNAIRRRRCLFVADAFYEWMKLDPKGKFKRPYRIFRPDQPLAMGGIYETWHSRDGSEIDTCAILTTSANGMLSAVHDRMPVILDPEDFDAWLSPETAQDHVLRLMRPADEDTLVMEPIERVGEPEEGRLL
ncbi:MAG: SOS response-associated peptidase [Rhabdaerophilum sp.]